MGLGSDGHTASLFPDAPALDEKERWALGVAKAGMEPYVPRVTLTFPAFASSREMLFLVDSADKRTILKRVLAGDDLPANRAHSNGDLLWLITRDAVTED
jgi:6-phosphogluconolactonase